MPVYQFALADERIEAGQLVSFTRDTDGVLHAIRYRAGVGEHRGTAMENIKKDELVSCNLSNGHIKRLK